MLSVYMIFMLSLYKMRQTVEKRSLQNSYNSIWYTEIHARHYLYRSI